MSSVCDGERIEVVVVLAFSLWTCVVSKPLFVLQTLVDDTTAQQDEISCER